jgi:hypothetical protein
MTQALTPAQQRTLQMILYDLAELGNELAAAGQSLVVTTHPLTASDRYTATVYGPTAQTFTWQVP